MVGIVRVQSLRQSDFLEHCQIYLLLELINYYVDPTSPTDTLLVRII